MAGAGGKVGGERPGKPGRNVAVGEKVNAAIKFNWSGCENFKMRAHSFGRAIFNIEHFDLSERSTI